MVLACSEDDVIRNEDGDLDGVIGRVTPTGVTWDLLEIKEGNETPGKQARKSAAWFGADAGKLDIKNVPGAKLAFVRVEPVVESI